MPTGVAVYSTNIDGIGYRINVQGVGFLPRTITTNSTTINGAVTDTCNIGMPSIQLSLVKTAPVTGNGYSRRVCMRDRLCGRKYAQQYIRSWSAAFGSSRPLQRRATVEQPGGRHGRVRRSWFTGVGNTQGQQAFDITVNCRVSANNQFNTVS